MSLFNLSRKEQSFRKQLLLGSLNFVTVILYSRFRISYIPLKLRFSLSNYDV